MQDAFQKQEAKNIRIWCNSERINPLFHGLTYDKHRHFGHLHKHVDSWVD